jgi:hypothetical protein
MQHHHSSQRLLTVGPSHLTHVQTLSAFVQARSLFGIGGPPVPRPERDDDGDDVVEEGVSDDEEDSPY